MVIVLLIKSPTKMRRMHVNLYCPRKKDACMLNSFLQNLLLNMHIASGTIFTIGGFILWPYSSQVTSSPCAKTVPRGGKYQIYNTVEPLIITDTKGAEQKVRVLGRCPNY